MHPIIPIIGAVIVAGYTAYCEYQEYKLNNEEEKDEPKGNTEERRDDPEADGDDDVIEL
jgi:hypothetical protein